MITNGAPRAAAPTADDPDAAMISTLPPSKCVDGSHAGGDVNQIAVQAVLFE